MPEIILQELAASMISPVYQDDLTTLYLGNSKDVMRKLQPNSISLINTDPPYLKGDVKDAYSILANESYRVMADNASLTTLVGHFAIDEVILIMSRSKLKWNWLIAMNQPIVHAKMPLGIEVTFKPILWYAKSNTFLKNTFMKDSFTVEEMDGILKPLYPWQQSISWANFFISHLVNRGGIVLDPFMGSGTTIVAARKRGIRSIGIDIDPKCIDITIKRIRSI